MIHVVLFLFISLICLSHSGHVKPLFTGLILSHMRLSSNPLRSIPNTFSKEVTEATDQSCSCSIERWHCLFVCCLWALNISNPAVLPISFHSGSTSILSPEDLFSMLINGWMGGSGSFPSRHTKQWRKFDYRDWVLEERSRVKRLHLTMGAGFAPVTMQTRVKFWAS